MKKGFCGLLASMLMLACVACGGMHATATVPTPDTAYGKALKVGLDITDSIHTGANTVDALRLNGTITKEDEKSTLRYFDALNRLDVDVYQPCVANAHLAGDVPDSFSSCGHSFLTQINDPMFLASFHIVNQHAQDQAKQIGSALVSALDLAISAIEQLKPQ